MKLEDQNILFLTRSMGLGGTENVILQLCEILKDKVNNIVVCSCGGINEEKLSKLGIKHYKINDIENKKPFNIIKTIKQIKQIIKNEKITIIHSHHRMAAMYANLCCNSNIIKIANAHNTFYDKKFFTKLAYRNTKIIAVGEKVKENLIEFFKIPDNNVTIIYNAIKEFNGNVIIDKQLNEDKKNGNILVANVGRLSKQKGMEYFIEAATLVNKKYKNVKFYIIGLGEDEEKLKKMVSDNNMNDYIVFMGYRNDIQNIFSQVDFCVLSSLWEGFPLTPIEAFSVGRTIIATSVDGTPEIVKNMCNGLLVVPQNSKAIANKIEYLIKNPSKINNFEKNALKTYYNEFSFEKLSKRYIDFYKKIGE